ncbi:MAG: DUF6516 family protein [Steroidobacteraceae bacterium]
MKAELLMRERLILSRRAFVEIVIWKLPQPLPYSRHAFKYRLAYIANQRCVLRFDNEAGKGDHKHLDEVEATYIFTSLDALQTDFWAEVNKRRRRK